MASTLRIGRAGWLRLGPEGSVLLYQASLQLPRNTGLVWRAGAALQTVLARAGGAGTWPVRRW